MQTGPERQLVGEIARALGGTFLEGKLILGGSSGLFGFPTDTPALTEDLDFLIREDLIAERRNEKPFVDSLRSLLGRFDRDRRDDALADSQAAFLSLQKDPDFHDRGAEGYLSFVEKVEEGFAALCVLHGGRDLG